MTQSNPANRDPLSDAPGVPRRADRIDCRRRLNVDMRRGLINPARTGVRPFSDIQVTSMTADSRTAPSQHARPSP